MSASAHVKDVDTAAFDREVLEKSLELPVVVDFWAPWCGPCRMLGPILEKEVDALGGRALLVKIDTDRNPELAQRYGIQGIPAVKAFRNGQVVDELVGALPAPQVRAWLGRLVPSDALVALVGAEVALRDGRVQEAADAFQGLLEAPDVKDRALLGLARAWMEVGALDGVPELLAKIDPRTEAADAIPTLERRLALFADAKAFGGEKAAEAALAANPKDLDARWALASAQAGRGALREALENFLEIVSRNRKFKDDGARLAMLALFDQLGTDHELAREYRRRLQIVL